MDSLKNIQRLLAYMLTNYKLPFLLVIVCIILSAAATLKGMLFVQTLVDYYIVPMLASTSPNFGPLASALLITALW